LVIWLFLWFFLFNWRRRSLTAGLEDAQGFAQHPGLVRREVDDAVGDDGVLGVAVQVEFVESKL
jgi:hypothetical protein